MLDFNSDISLDFKISHGHFLFDSTETFQYHLER